MKTLKHKDILFISPVGEFYGGGERSGLELCKFLKDKGYNVITALPRSSKEYKSALEEAGMKYRLLDCNDFENQIMEGNDAFPRVVSQLDQVIKEEKVSLVISNLYVQSGPIAAILNGIPNISMDRGQAYYGTYFTDFMAKFSDAVVVNSMELARIYRERYQIEAPIVYSYTTAPKVGLNPDIKERRIVCVSRVAPDKNLLQMLKALRSLKEQKIFEGKLLIIGPVAGPVEQEYKRDLEEYIKKNNLEDNVDWMGDRENPWGLVGQKDIYLNTSEKESVGRSNIEAIKLGVPAILVDIPGHRDIFDKIGAISYKANNTGDLVAKIRYVIENYQKVKIDAESTRIKAEKIINKEDCNKEIIPLIERLDERTGVALDSLFAHILNLANEAARRLKESEEEYRRVVASRDAEIASFLGIRRSARIFAGNIKRKIERSINKP